jgi:hypothetical protein
VNFHRSETPRENTVAVVDDQVPASGWMSVDIGRMFAGSVTPTVSLGASAPATLIAAAPAVVPAPVTQDAPVASDGSAEAPVAAELRSEPAGEVAETMTPPRRVWPKRTGAKTRREPPLPNFPRHPMRRVPDRDLIVVRAAPPAPAVEEPVLDLAEVATPVPRPAPRRRWWIVALLATVLAGGLAYSFTGLGETRVISVPDTGRKDSVVT